MGHWPAEAGYMTGGTQQGDGGQASLPALKPLALRGTAPGGPQLLERGGLAPKSSDRLGSHSKLRGPDAEILRPCLLAGGHVSRDLLLQLVLCLVAPHKAQTGHQS